MLNELIIEAGRTERNYWSDLWRYRELFGVLAWRDVSVRYKQTALGVAWSVIRPLLTMAVFTVIFGRVARLQSDGSWPYPLMVFSGLLPWMLFSTILAEASASIVVNSSLIGKVYFPRIIVPTATSLVAVVDFAVSFGLLAVLIGWYRAWPDWRLLLLPGFLLLALLAALGPALLMTAMNVKYRDFRYVIPFIMQFGIYVSPVGFSTAVLPAQWRLWYSFNPIVGVIDGFRWCLSGGQAALFVPGLCASIATTVLFFWGGIYYFRRTERTFVDII